MAVTFIGYDVYRGYLFNGSDLQLIGRVSTLDVGGQVDSIFVDTDPAPTKVYRVKAVFLSGVELATDFSDIATTIQFPTPIDAKTEQIDDKLFVLDQSLLDEGLLI